MSGGKVLWLVLLAIAVRVAWGYVLRLTPLTWWMLVAGAVALVTILLFAPIPHKKIRVWCKIVALSVVLGMLLNIILWVLLVVVAIILLFMILLALPIRYIAAANVGGSKGTSAKAKVRYLFGLIRGNYVYDKGEGELQAYIAWFKLSKKQDEEKRGSSEKVMQQSPVEIVKDIDALKDIDDTPSPGAFAKEDKPTFFSSLKAKFTKIKGKINTVLEYPNKRLIAGLVMGTLKKMAKLLKPKHINISGTIGFADPAATGMFFAAYESVTHLLNIRQNVKLDGNFDTEKTTVVLDVYAKGSISIGRMMLPLIGLALKKPIRKIIVDMLF